MIAAIYARKSTDQAGVAEDQKSVARQIEHARSYAMAKGWSVSDDDVFLDDGISGAEFANRPGFLRLMNSLKPRARFQALVMSEESRLGREAIETAYALKQLVQAGVRVFFYLEDRERTLDSPTDKIMMSLTAFADELEREKARQRTSDAMVRKAKAGHVTGGRVFGYDNHRVQAGHVERRINESEAVIVRRIFELCAAGTGYTRIAKLLNAERALSPRAQQGRPTGWSPSSVHEMLKRPLYRGEVLWNQTRKRDRWGQSRRSARPVAEIIRMENPALRIVSDELWQAAHGRLAGIRANLRLASCGRSGVRRRDVESRYLLPGFARCGVCGGSIGAISRSHGKRRVFFYGCLAHYKRGSTVCANAVQVPMDRVDQAVLRALGGDVLRPAVVMAVVRGVLDALAPQARSRDVERLRGELAEFEASIGRLTAAIEAGGHLPSILESLRAREAQKRELLATLAGLEANGTEPVDREAIERHVKARLEQWKDLLTESIQDGRQLLREALAGPLRFTPEGRAYRFEGEVAVGQLLTGMADVGHLLWRPQALRVGTKSYNGSETWPNSGNRGSWRRRMTGRKPNQQPFSWTILIPLASGIVGGFPIEGPTGPTQLRRWTLGG